MNTAANHNIIAIASGKGGVGKTWLSITLTHLLARAGRRVVLFDGDIGLANVDVQLGINPTQDLGAVFAGKATLKDIVMKHESNGFDLIAGRSGSGSLATLPTDLLMTLRTQIEALARDYDYVLMDLGAGIEKNVRFLSSIASRAIVVVTDEPTSLTDAYAYIKLCLQQEVTPDLQIVINQANSQKEGEKTYAALNKACMSFLKYSPPLLGIVRRDNKVRDSIRSQSSIVEKAPGCTAATDAAAISVKLMQPRSG
jgi:flagellar biosynthesis protein FlhG